MKAAAGLCFGFAKRSVNCADSVLNNIRLAAPSHKGKQIVGGGGLPQAFLAFAPP